MAEVVYLLCAATSVACAVLLMRGYARTGTRLLLWSGLCFVGLALNNVALVIDRMVVPDVDYSTGRLVPAAAGILLLLYGLVWEAE
ncbi:MAG: DUF5985 family protein [Acidimicrobiia bacterium]